MPTQPLAPISFNITMEVQMADGKELTHDELVSFLSARTITLANSSALSDLSVDVQLIVEKATGREVQAVGWSVLIS